MQTYPTLQALAKKLSQHGTTSRALVEQCLTNIADPAGEGARAFVKVHADQARAAADASDRLREKGCEPSPFSGIPISIKDLFDVAGDVTKAGSIVLDDHAPAKVDAVSVARLRKAGFVIMGRTQMTEFAFSGVGLNPHYEAPSSIWDRASQRVPGGSTSGGAISVADGMAHGALGTDTGGSCRIPAAFNSLVGFKPTADRVSTEGGFPLSYTLDSVGSLARSVECVAILDSILAGEPVRALNIRPLDTLRVAVPRTMVLDGMDAHVGAAFERTLAKLKSAGATVTQIDVPEFSEIAQMNSKGGFAAAESYEIHKELMVGREHLYDPRVISRIMRGKEQSAADYAELVSARAAVIARYQARLRDFDVCAFPTVPVVAPRKTEFDTDAEFGRLNLLLLRNPALINVLDGCAISLPMQVQGEAPVGLMLSMPHGADHALLDWAASVEALLTQA